MTHVATANLEDMMWRSFPSYGGTRFYTMGPYLPMVFTGRSTKERGSKPFPEYPYPGSPWFTGGE